MKSSEPLPPAIVPPTVCQVQVGASPRSAGRDYKETHHHYSSITYWELTASAKDLNELAIQNEKNFRRRFGFDLPMEQRRDIIDLKIYWDLTDREVSRLKTGGVLRVAKGKDTCLCADQLLVAYGVFCLSLGLIWGTVYGSGFLMSDMLPLKQLLGLVVIGCFTIPMILASSAISIWPLRIIRQRGLRLGQKWVLREHVPFHLPSSV